MRKEKFTPGPWHQREHHTFAQFDIYADVNQFGDEDSFNHVAEIRIDEFNDPIDEEQRYKYGPTLSANADLITAAPEMYELLQRIKDEMECTPEWYRFMNDVETILKKARGEA